MTSLPFTTTIHVPWTSPTLRNALVVRQGIAWTRYLDVMALVASPVVVTLGIAAAAVMWPANAHADVATDSGTGVLNGVGIGNNGPVSTAIAGAGQSICPMLVQPGSQLVSMATQTSGQGGLAPTIAGWVATMVIQTQCPGWMTSLSNGQMPAGLDTLTNMAGPGLALPRSAPAAPFALPGTSLTPPAGLTIPGL
jgi:hypothetical protein